MTMTLAPAALAWMAAARPMPDVPPKMTTVRPSSCAVWDCACSVWAGLMGLVLAHGGLLVGATAAPMRAKLDIHR
jgi:hypothetical protein